VSLFIFVESLSKANKRADDLACKLERSEKAREKAESDDATVEGLRKRLQDAENALSENAAQQSARSRRRDYYSLGVTKPTLR
jgi:small-conductance mechanosensitive channel